MSARPLLVGPLIDLGTLAPFRALSHRQLSAIAYETEEVMFEADSWLLAKGEPVQAMCMILDGYVDVVRSTGVTTSGPGELVGFPDILVSGPAPHGARARGDVLALRLATDELRDLCEHNFAILASLLVHLAERVSEDSDALARSVDTAPGDWPVLPEGVLDRVGRMVALHRAPTFPGTSMDALAELAGNLDQVALGAGDALWEPGEPAGRFCLVCRGSLELRAAGRPSTTVRPGGVAGLAETLASLTFHYAARASEPTTLLMVDMDTFMDVIEDHFEMGFSLLGSLAKHLIGAK